MYKVTMIPQARLSRVYVQSLVGRLSDYMEGQAGTIGNN